MLLDLNFDSTFLILELRENQMCPTPSSFLINRTETVTSLERVIEKTHFREFYM